MPACSTAAVDRSRVGVFLGAGTADLLRNETFYQTWITAGLDATRPSDVWNHFSSTPVDAIAERFGFEGPRGCVVAACSSSTIAIGRAADAIRYGRADAVLAGGTDALSRLTFSGFNQLRLMDPAPCRPFDREPRRHEHRRRRRRSWCSRISSARAAAARRSTPSSPATASAARRSTRRRRSPRAGRSPRSSRRRWPTRAIDAERGRSHQRARHRDAAERRRRSARRSGACSASGSARVPVTSIKSMIGHCLGAAGAVEAAVAGADDRARRDPADDPPRRDRPGLRRRRRRQPGARAARPLRRVDVARLRRQRLGAGHARVRGVRSDSVRLEAGHYGRQGGFVSSRRIRT